MFISALVFIVTIAIVLGAYTVITRSATRETQRQVALRLRDLGSSSASDESVVTRRAEGPMPLLDKALARSAAGSGLTRLIEQSGVQTTTSVIVMASLGAALLMGGLATLLVRVPFVPAIAAAFGLCLPVLWLVQRRNGRRRQFEEMFPDALDLISRAIRAGHAFQTALGMVAEEVKPPVGPEFKKAFEQQNFGLPLNEALMDLADRVPIIDVRFFVTAVAIQRETGGNLAEILDNLAHVVRERFKIKRQVQVYTAHGRFTGYVLVALPGFLAVALSLMNPEHMNVLFHEHIGQMLLVGAVVMQVLGFMWIRQVIRIEV